MNPRTPHHRRSQHGAVAVAFILFVVLLLGFVAFAMDVGRLYVSKAELQNAADSCALSASAALTGANANQLGVAENYGIAAGRQNLVAMQETAVDIAPNRDVTFSETLNGVYRTKDAAAANALAMRYVRCTVSEPDVSPIMLQVIGLLGQTVQATTVGATAVASLEPSKSNCALPLAICQEELQAKNVQVGDWIEGLFEPGDSITGAYKWIKYPGYEQNKDLAELMRGAGQCDLNSTSTVESHPGYDGDLRTAWNSRFGIYKKPNEEVLTSPPDMTGWVYDRTIFPEAKNALPDFLQKRAQATPKKPPQSQFDLKGAYKWAQDEDFQQYGQDRRLVVGPIVKCADLGGSAGKVSKIIDWGCYLMLNPVLETQTQMILEYRGLASDPASGCVTSGAPGGPTAGGPKVPALVQ
jgi:Flp pilus assembly protein TadG